MIDSIWRIFHLNLIFKKCRQTKVVLRNLVDDWFHLTNFLFGSFADGHDTNWTLLFFRPNSSIVQVDHLYQDLRNSSTKGWVVARTSLDIFIRFSSGDFWDRGQSLSHLALLVRQDWSPSAPTSLFEVELWSSSIHWIIGRCLSKLLLITFEKRNSGQSVQKFWLWCWSLVPVWSLTGRFTGSWGGDLLPNGWWLCLFLTPAS